MIFQELTNPKLYKLQERLVQHFKQTENSSVVVFTQFRETVAQILALLKQNEPGIAAVGM